MKKRLTLVWAALLATFTVQAQVVSYDVLKTTADYESVAGGTVIDLQGNTGVNLSKILLDNDGNVNITAAEDVSGFPIGFTFPYNGQQMTHFVLTGDGAVVLSPTATVTTSIHTQFNPANQLITEDTQNTFGLLMRRGFYGLDDTELSYQVQGNEGSRVLIIQYKNVGVRANGDLDDVGFAIDRIYTAKAQLQYRLYEESGDIEMHVTGFKPETQVGIGNLMRIGIVGDKKDWLFLKDYDATDASTDTDSPASINYTADSYPADNTVYTFVAPEPCLAPARAAADLVLNPGTTQIDGTFTTGDADHYLVLVGPSATLTAAPADQTKYSVGDELGGATVAAITTEGTFTATGLEPQTAYCVFVYAYNTQCLNGPLYHQQAATASTTTMAGAPTALAVTDADKTTLTLAITPNGTNPVLVAVSTQQAQDRWGDYINGGVFATPSGTYSVGDPLQEDDLTTVVFCGTTTGTITVTGLTEGTPYFVRAWTTDCQGHYSTDYIETSGATAADEVWAFVADESVGYEAVLPGWTKSDNDTWASVLDQPAYLVDRTGEGQAWIETPYIYLGQNKAHVQFTLGGSQGGGWFSGDWFMDEGEYVALLVNDGDELTEVYRVEGATLTRSELSSYQTFFEGFAGKKVKLRLLFNRTVAGESRIGSIAVDDYEGDVYGIVGNIPGLSETTDLVMDLDEDNVYTAALTGVEISELPAEAYTVKVRANMSADDVVATATWLPTQTGTYVVAFSYDAEAKELTVTGLQQFEVQYGNEGSWGEVYAYTWTVNDDGTVTEQLGPWPGTQAERGSGWFAKYTVSILGESAPQYIIWNNGASGDEAEQTANLAFENGKVYSYYAEITSLQLQGNFIEDGNSGWTAIDFKPVYDDDLGYATCVLDLTGQSEDKEFKLVVNGGGDASDNWAGWIGTNNLQVEAPAGWVVSTAATSNQNLKLNHSITGYASYNVEAYLTDDRGPVYYENWVLEISGKDLATGISDTTRQTSDEMNHQYFDLQGRSVAQPSRGLYITGGKKVVRK